MEIARFRLSFATMQAIRPSCCPPRTLRGRHTTTTGVTDLYSCTVACPPGNPGGYKGAYAVSYNRPFDGAAIDGGASYLFYAEYQMIRFLERNGYDMSYTSSADVDRAGSLLLNHKLVISSGHDEYWSAGQRANVTAARDAGVNLAFFSGNEVFWKTRWANSRTARARHTGPW